jgi:DNA-binding NarL/FixJ family response regulator
LRAGEAALAAMGPAGGHAAAREALRSSASICARIGAVPLLEAVERLARLARIDLRSAADASTGPEAGGAADRDGQALGLTPRELEVLRLVAAGWSNPEIAAELGISAKTASVHVSNVLAKLGVPNRVEAAVAAMRLGLADPR